jgi:hypothetical protein
MIKGVLLCGCLLVGCTPAPAVSPASGSGSNEALLSVGMRRLTNREFVHAAETLLQAPLPLEFADSLPPDVRQEDGYTRNRAQTMSSALALKLADELPAILTELLRSGQSNVFTCKPAVAECVKPFVEAVLARAYRRPSENGDVAELVRVFVAASRTGEPLDGAVSVLSTVLQSPRFWYVTENGELMPPGDGVVRLGRAEVADQLAFVMRGEAPDEALLQDVERMYDPQVRLFHARRLLSDARARRHYREFVLQWLEVDQLARSHKSDAVLEQYEAFTSRMLAETVNFADEVFVHEGASVRSLLTAGFVSVDPNMAVFYGLEQYGARVPSTHRGRVGVLQQASFLAAHAHADTTSPVLRGDFVLRKVLCERVPRPSELDIEIIMPRPSTDLTRREQFAMHAADAKCAQCHDKIDGFGLTLERFDAAGRSRELELEKPVRTDGKVSYQGTPLEFRDSVQLSRWLGDRPEAADCFARHAFRFVTGQHAPGAEDAFVALRRELPARERNNLLEHLVAYVGTETFIWRSAP